MLILKVSSYQAAGIMLTLMSHLPNPRRRPADGNPSNGEYRGRMLETVTARFSIAFCSYDQNIKYDRVGNRKPLPNLVF